MSDNSMMVIHPYLYQGTWVFDDPAAGLDKEPFVEGIPAMMDELTAAIPGASDGFRCLFSRDPFPGYQVKLVLDHEEFGGHWYLESGSDRRGWLCPALMKYFDSAPEEIYVKAEAK